MLWFGLHTCKVSWLRWRTALLLAFAQTHLLAQLMRVVILYSTLAGKTQNIKLKQTKRTAANNRIKDKFVTGTIVSIIFF